MLTPNKNAPCPCDSGKKYKKCCLPKAARPSGARVVTHRGHSLLVPNTGGTSPGVLDQATDYFEAKNRGGGPAAKMMRFIEPLMERANQEAALTLGMMFWNLALCDDSMREEMLAKLIKGAIEEQDEEGFRTLAHNMVERHNMMFPEMHK